MTRKNVQLVSFSPTPAQLEAIDKYMEQHGIKSRTTFILMALKAYMGDALPDSDTQWGGDRKSQDDE